MADGSTCLEIDRYFCLLSGAEDSPDRDILRNTRRSYVVSNPVEYQKAIYMPRQGNAGIRRVSIVRHTQPPVLLTPCCIYVQTVCMYV